MIQSHAFSVLINWSTDDYAMGGNDDVIDGGIGDDVTGSMRHSDHVDTHASISDSYVEAPTREHVTMEQQQSAINQSETITKRGSWVEVEDGFVLV